MTRQGTACFINIDAALAFYAPYGYDSNDVADKIDCEIIKIGEPELREGESLWLNKAEGRYFILVKD